VHGPFGYLTAATAAQYREILQKQTFMAESSGFPYSNQAARDIHAIWIPELKLDLVAECERLHRIMDQTGCVNVFFGEGTGVHEIIADMEGRGETVARDALAGSQQDQSGQYFISIRSRRKIGEIGVLSAPLPPTSLIAIIDRCAVKVSSHIDGIRCMGQDEDKKVIRSGY
jgi:pyrophosphate--fructose-6-phosphate 1-phosphotransferase